MSAASETNRIILKGGHVIDAANGVNKVTDVAIANGAMKSPSVSVMPFVAEKNVSPPSVDFRIVGKPWISVYRICSFVGSIAQ